MTQHGKKYTDAAKKIDREEVHTIPAAVALIILLDCMIPTLIAFTNGLVW